MIKGSIVGDSNRGSRADFIWAGWTLHATPDNDKGMRHSASETSSGEQFRPPSTTSQPLYSTFAPPHCPGKPPPSFFTCVNVPDANQRSFACCTRAAALSEGVTISSPCTGVNESDVERPDLASDETADRPRSWVRILFARDNFAVPNHQHTTSVGSKGWKRTFAARVGDFAADTTGTRADHPQADRLVVHPRLLFGLAKLHSVLQLPELGLRIRLLLLSSPTSHH